jgi:hypothetical protein
MLDLELRLHRELGIEGREVLRLLGVDEARVEEWLRTPVTAFTAAEDG